jgi:hypothetical protein
VGAGSGYDEEARILGPGFGACLIFSYGFRPSPLDLAHVKVRVYSSAFTATFSTRRDRTSASALGGRKVSFLEKSETDWWAKYVVSVR